MSLDRPPVSEEFRDAAEHSPTRAAQSKAPPPFSLRLSAAEKAELLAKAGSMPLGAYIRSQLLGNGARPRRASRRPTRDHQALAKLLAELGKSRLSSNLNQLAKAANTGTLIVAQETELALIQACRDVHRMRHTLMAALGFRAEP